MARKGGNKGISRGLLGRLGPRGPQARPGFAAAKAANSKAAQGGGGSSSMRKLLGAGADAATRRPTQRPTQRPTKTGTEGETSYN